MSNPAKEVRQLRRAVEDQHFPIRETSKGFFVFPRPGDTGDPVLIHWTSSCPRWKKNTLAALRRIGFQEPGRGKGKKK